MKIENSYYPARVFLLWQSLYLSLVFESIAYPLNLHICVCLFGFIEVVCLLCLDLFFFFINNYNALICTPFWWKLLQFTLFIFVSLTIMYKVPNFNAGHCPVQNDIRNSERCSTAKCYIRPVLGRPNLQVSLQSHVTKVYFNVYSIWTPFHCWWALCTHVYHVWPIEISYYIKLIGERYKRVIQTH